MISYRDGERILLCDGCYNPIDKGEANSRKVNQRGTNVAFHFHNRRCEDRWKHRGDEARRPDTAHHHQ